jgi:hypothetical protein
MKSKTRIVAKDSPSLTPEQVRDVRAKAWSYVFSCYGKHKAVGKDRVALKTPAEAIGEEKKLAAAADPGSRGAPAENS